MSNRNASHLSVVADNRDLATPYRTCREREARRAELGIVAHYGGRSLPVVIVSGMDPFNANYHHPEDCVQLPCDVE